MKMKNILLIEYDIIDIIIKIGYRQASVENYSLQHRNTYC